MCLSKETETKDYKERSPILAWKVFRPAVGDPKYMRTSLRLSYVKVGKWLRANDSLYGFHAFARKKDAIEYKSSIYEVVVRVKLAGTVIFGMQEVTDHKGMREVPAMHATRMLVPRKKGGYE